MNKYAVYLVRCSDGSLYCGVSTDVERRVRQHNAGTASKYTRSRRPVELVAETYLEFSRRESQHIEHIVKGLPQKHKIDFVRAR